jgi:L-ascorbate metabolism protein UlaG (beta-lactamase superfamily)
MTIEVTWHGHAALSIKVNGSTIVVDPFFTDNSAAKTKAADIDADYILISHGHRDHVGDALDIARRTGALVISNFEISTWFVQQGYEKVHGQHIGGGFQHPFGHVKLTVAFHGSMLPDGAYGGMPAGFLLTIEGKKIYIAADTALYSDMKLIGREGLDLAIIPIGDNYTMGPADAVMAVQFLEPKVVIPYHFNTWELISQDPYAWADDVRAKCTSQVIVLSVDDSYTI